MWAATVGVMASDPEVVVAASCSRCGYHKKRVELQPIIDRFGADYSLFDKRPRCRTKGCSGRVLFSVGIGKGPMRPCTT